MRARLDRDGRDQTTLTTSMMTWCYVGTTEAEAMDRIGRVFDRSMRAERFADEIDELRATCVVGSADQAVEQLRAYEAVGVQRIMLNHELFDDLDMLEVLATQVFPRLRKPS